MISERLRDTYGMWSDPNSPYCDGTPHGAEVVLEAADVICALVAAVDEMRRHNLHSAYLTGVADKALAMARRK